MVDRLAKEHLRSIESRISDPTALRRELKATIASGDGGTVATCRVIETLGPAT